VSPPARSPVLLRAALTGVVLLAPLLVSAELSDGPPPIHITVNDRPVALDSNTTFGGAVRELELRAAPGKLVAVDGAILDPRADPGHLLLNGSQAARPTPLADGDSIRVENGTDRVEGTKTSRELIPGRRTSNPMFTLDTTKTVKITTVGRVSGTVASVRYRPIGPVHRPPQVALTFDDGPWPNSTRRFLSVLQRMKVKATFFMVGYLVERYPDIVRSVIRAGMTIGDHSWSHPYRTPFKDLKPHRIQTEVARPAALLRHRFGVDVRLFRAPGGSYDGKVIRTARAAGMHLVQWSIDPRDYLESAKPAKIAATVLSQVEPGSIVLMHDGGGDQSATLRALPRIIRGIRRMGLELVAIDG
jgi:peptidoglycan/xylan/chitin deacetylase (PgdA/CDA1 family)/sulfur carrier protein ThiS